MEKDHKKKEDFDGMKEDWRPTGGESDRQKNYLNKGTKPSGKSPADLKIKKALKVLEKAINKLKEGDGAGNSGVISTETAGVYNPRNSGSDGRYRDQQKDKEEEEKNERNT